MRKPMRAALAVTFIFVWAAILGVSVGSASLLDVIIVVLPAWVTVYVIERAMGWRDRSNSA